MRVSSGEKHLSATLHEASHPWREMAFIIYPVFSVSPRADLSWLPSQCSALAALIFGHSLLWDITLPSWALHGDIRHIGRDGAFQCSSEAPKHLIVLAPEKIECPTISPSHEGEHHCERQSIKHCEMLRHHNEMGAVEEHQGMLSCSPFDLGASELVSA